MDARSNDLNTSVRPTETPNWPELLSKTVDDLTRVLGSEARLVEATLKQLIEARGEKLVGLLVAMIALGYGALLLVGAIILFIHLWLDWWLSFLITAVAVIAAGVLFQMAMGRSARAKSA